MDIRQLINRTLQKSQRIGPALLVAVLAGVAGLLTLQQSSAATSAASSETETGIVTGNAQTLANQTGASSNASVAFSQGGGQPGDGCPAYPAFPDASCTGWQHTGVSLKTVPGQVTSGTGWSWEGSPLNYVKVTGNNAVLDGLDIAGCVYVDNGVTTATIKRSRITGNCDYMIRYGDANASINLQVSDTEIVGGAVQHKGAGFSWLRVNAHDFTGKAAMTGSGSSVVDSYIHGIVCNPPDHQSGMGTNGGTTGVILRHNQVDLQPTECTSGGIANYDDFGAFHDILIENNLINSGGYCIKTGFEDGNAAGNSGMQVLNNVFGRKYFAECGSFGVQSNWMPAVSGNAWAGNTWGGGSAATAVHAIGDPVNP
jgi:hypothetical protein